MVKILSQNEIIPTDWNNVVTHPVQTFEWGEFRSELGTEVVYIADLNASNELVGAFLMTIHTIPFINKKLGNIGMSITPSSDVIDFLEEYSKERNLVFVKIEPDLFKSDSVELDPRLIKSPTPNFYRWTSILDLSGSEEEVLQSFKKDCRYSIRVAEKKGVTIKQEDTTEAHKIFVDLLDQTAKRQGFGYHTPEYHQELWKHLGNKMAHLLVAYHESKPIAAFELFCFKERLYYPYAGNDYASRNLMASNLLMWEAVKFGKKLGAKSFDLWGIIEPDSTEHSAWQGFSKFKESFGGERKELVGSYDLVNSSFWYKIYNLAFEIRKKLKG